MIDLQGVSGLNSFADVEARWSQVGSDVVIDLGGGDTLTLQNQNIADLHQNDFLI